MFRCGFLFFFLSFFPFLFFFFLFFFVFLVFAFFSFLRFCVLRFLSFEETGKREKKTFREVLYPDLSIYF